MCKIERKTVLGKETMMTTSLKTLEHTVICTYTHIQKYTTGHDPETARLNHTNLRGASKRYRTGQNNFNYRSVLSPLTKSTLEFIHRAQRF